MKRTLTRALTFVLAAALLQSAAPAQPPPPSAPAQTWPPAAPPTMRTPPDVDADDDVVRITSNLVQFDAVVTDKQGRQVTDLKAGDFDVLVDGKPQALTHLSYVSNLGAPTPAADSTADAAPAQGVPPARLRPEQVRRTVAFVFGG